MTREKFLFWGPAFLVFLLIGIVVNFLTHPLYLPLGVAYSLFDVFGLMHLLSGSMSIRLASSTASVVDIAMTVLAIPITGIFLTWPLLLPRSLKISIIAALLTILPVPLCFVVPHCGDIGIIAAIILSPFYLVALLLLQIVRRYLAVETWQTGALLGAVLYILLALPSLLLL